MVEIALDAPASQAPVALQWEIDFPAGQLTVAGKGPMAGKAANDSGKSLTCIDRWKKAPQIYSYTCILAGGQKPIANGPVAVIEFKEVAKVSRRKADVRVENIRSVTADLKKMVLKDVTVKIMPARNH